MAETKEVVFPLNLTDEFRAKADGWLHAQLGRGSADMHVLRDLQRSILVTRGEWAAELYASDFMQRLDLMAANSIIFREGMLDCWNYQVELKAWGRGQQGLIQEWFTSDHLCRIVTRMVEASEHFEVIGWPEDWPVPVYKGQKAA